MAKEPAPFKEDEKIGPGYTQTFKSPITGTLYTFLMPTAAEYRRLIPQENFRVNPNTGEISVQLSDLDPLLTKYVDPPPDLEEIPPFELTWLEQTMFSFLSAAATGGAAGEATGG